MSRNHRNDLRTAYDAMAAVRDRNQITPWKDNQQQAFLDLLKFEERCTLLELGSGPGLDAYFFQENGLTVSCTDLSAKMVRHCRQKGLNAQIMDMADLTFESGSFDAAYAWSSLLHIAKAELPAVLDGICRVLVPGGLFFMGVWGGREFEGIWLEDSYRPQRFFSFYTDEAMQNIVSDHFVIVSFESTEIDGNGRYQTMTLRNHSTQR